MKRQEFLNVIRETNKHQAIVVNNGYEGTLANQWDQINKSVEDTIIMLIENMQDFINEFGYNWYKMIVLDEDEHVMLWEFGEAFDLIEESGIQ